MVEFTVYEPMSGGILRYGECPLDDWEKQAGPGEMLWPLREALRDDMWKIVDGHKVPLKRGK